MKQYIHLLSNTGVGLPTDLWVPATNKVKPQQSWQVAAGYAYDFTKYNLGFSTELYYKEMNNIIGYKEGASFIMIDNFTSAEEVDWQKNITSGKGKSYGMELLLQRKTGKLSGWIGYTLSWTRHQFEELNYGESFWAKYDRRHDLSLVAIYNLNERITLSGVWVFGTGEAITLPQSKFFDIPESYRPGMYFYSGLTDYGKRNDFRMKNYHRLDLCVQFHKNVRLGERIWEFGIYNAYARKNPFFYTLEEEYDRNTNQHKTVLKQVSLFPLVPSISYTLKF